MTSQKDTSAGSNGTAAEWKGLSPSRSESPPSRPQPRSKPPATPRRDPKVEAAAKAIYQRQLAEERAEEMRSERNGQTERYGIDGAEFLLDAPPTVPTLWGDGGSKVLAIEGEGTVIVGPQGVGKSTTAQQLALCRIGARTDGLFGFDVKPDDRPVLYLAMDRPAQISRSFRRSITELDRSLLKERLRVWRGPLPFDPLRAPDRFVEWVKGHDDAGMVMLDSYKDLASGLSKDDVGDAVNRLMQQCLAAGIEWVGLHHQRKSSAENRKPRALDDVYGSVWLTAGAGSVLLLWGSPGAAMVELSHLKQPMENVGPLLVSHSQAAGVSSADAPEDKALMIIEAAGPHGVTEAAMAGSLYGDEESATRKRTRRLLDKITARDGSPVEFVVGGKGGSGGGGNPARWRWCS